MILEGKTWKFGDNVDTDVIIPARYLNTTNPEELGRCCMSDIDAGFTDRINKGDMIVAGRNFGCGSSREHAPVAIKAAGISCVIAVSFARIFYRNAINIGLPILECPELVNKTGEQDIIRVNLSDGTITNLTTGTSYSSTGYPPFLRDIIDAGGLLNYARRSG